MFLLDIFHLKTGNKNATRALQVKTHSHEVACSCNPTSNASLCSLVACVGCSVSFPHLFTSNKFCIFLSANVGFLLEKRMAIFSGCNLNIKWIKNSDIFAWYGIVMNRKWQERKVKKFIFCIFY